MSVMPLGSVAWTVMVSFASARNRTVCSIWGGVWSFCTVCRVTVIGEVCPTRFPESTANPTTVKNPPVAAGLTSTESTKSSVSGNGGEPLTSESPVCVVWPAAPPTDQPIRLTPAFCAPATWMGMYFPGDPTAPGVGCSR